MLSNKLKFVHRDQVPTVVQEISALDRPFTIPGNNEINTTL